MCVAVDVLLMLMVFVFGLCRVFCLLCELCVCCLVVFVLFGLWCLLCVVCLLFVLCVWFYVSVSAVWVCWMRYAV